MKILKSKRFLVSCVLIASLVVIASCKKKNQLVEFDLLPVSTGVIQLDNNVDTVINGLSYYSDTLFINNNFFRTACEENGVNTSDVESVYLVSSTVNVVLPQNMAGSFFTSITQLFLNPDGRFDTISEANFASSAIPGELMLKSTNLKAYFDNVATTMPVFFGVGDSVLSEADVIYNLQFRARGYSH